MTPCSPTSCNQCRNSITVPHCPAGLLRRETRCCILYYTVLRLQHCSSPWRPRRGQLSGLPSVVRALRMGQGWLSL